MTAKVSSICLTPGVEQVIRKIAFDQDLDTLIESQNTIFNCALQSPDFAGMEPNERCNLGFDHSCIMELLYALKQMSELPQSNLQVVERRAS